MNKVITNNVKSLYACKQDLKQLINTYRNELNKEALKGLNSNKTIELSQQINILINEYYRLF